jgi:uncharacterized damage-inducible protein DinB
MSVVLADFFRHNLWANLRLLDACANLSNEQLDTGAKGTRGTIRETLLHLCAAEGRYVSRFTGQKAETALSERSPFPGFEALQQSARTTGEALIAIVERGEATRTLHISYGGADHETSASIVLIQAINHATDHRSQIATMLSLQDIIPPELDGWSYYDVMAKESD